MVAVLSMHAGSEELCRAMLVHLDGDYPALAKLLNRKTQPTPEACYFCKEAGVPSGSGSKTLYGQFWRYLPEDHPGRAVAHKLNYINPRNETNPIPDIGSPPPPPRTFSSADDAGEEGISTSLSGCCPLSMAQQVASLKHSWSCSLLFTPPCTCMCTCTLAHFAGLSNAYQCSMHARYAPCQPCSSSANISCIAPCLPQCTVHAYVPSSRSNLSRLLCSSNRACLLSCVYGACRDLRIQPAALLGPNAHGVI